MAKGAMGGRWVTIGGHHVFMSNKGGGSGGGSGNGGANHPNLVFRKAICQFA